MKRLLFAAALAVATVPALAADVGVSISIGQPGFYGQIDIGGYPPPRVIYREPRSHPAGIGESPADLPERAPWPRQKLAQALRQVQRLRRTGLFRAKQLV